MSDHRLTSYGELADILEHLGLLVRETRRARGLTLREAAAVGDVGANAIFRVESGLGCSLDSAVAILRWLDARPASEAPAAPPDPTLSASEGQERVIRSQDDPTASGSRTDVRSGEGS